MKIDLQENAAQVKSYADDVKAHFIWIIMAIVMRTWPASLVELIFDNSLLGKFLHIIAKIGMAVVIYKLVIACWLARRKRALIWAIGLLHRLEVPLSLTNLSDVLKIRQAKKLDRSTLFLLLAIEEMLKKGVFANLQWNADKTELIEIAPSQPDTASQ